MITGLFFLLSFVYGDMISTLMVISLHNSLTFELSPFYNFMFSNFPGISPLIIMTTGKCIIVLLIFSTLLVVKDKQKFANIVFTGLGILGITATLNNLMLWWYLR